MMVSAPAAAQSQKDKIERVERHLAATRSMTADFVQTDQKGGRHSGTMAIKRPGKVKFDFGKAANMVMVADGQNLHFIDYEVGQKSSWDIGDSPLSVLLRPRPDLDRIARIVPHDNERVMLVRARDPRRPEYGTIVMIFTKSASAPAGLQLEGWTAVDAQGKRTAVTLSKQRYNIAIPDSRFAFRDPG